jgi:hypothetical protein
MKFNRGLLAASLAVGAALVSAAPASAWSYFNFATGCAGHLYGTSGNGNVCMWDGSYRSGGGGTIAYLSQGVSGYDTVPDLRAYNFSTGVEVGYHITSYASGDNVPLDWYTGLDGNGSYLYEQPLGYRMDLAINGYNNVFLSFIENP